MLATDRSDRSTLDQALQSPWFTESSEEATTAEINEDSEAQPAIESIESSLATQQDDEEYEEEDSNEWITTEGSEDDEEHEEDGNESETVEITEDGNIPPAMESPELSLATEQDDDEYDEDSNESAISDTLDQADVNENNDNDRNEHNESPLMTRRGVKRSLLTSSDTSAKRVKSTRISKYLSTYLLHSLTKHE